MRAQLLFVALPYLAVAALIVVPFVRALGVLRSAWPQPDPAEPSPGRAPWTWRWGIGLVIGGHLAAFLIPGGFAFLHGRPQLTVILELCGWLAAVLALSGLAQRLWQLRSTRIAWLDSLLLTLLAVQVASGLGVTLIYRWGSLWYADTLLAYLGSLARFEPDVSLVIGLPTWVRLHTVAGFVTLALLPFSRLRHVLGFSPARPWPALRRRRSSRSAA